MTRDYDDTQTLQQKIMKGVNILTDNVASTLGPKGRNVLLQEKGKTPFITKDGVTVAHFVELEDPFENAGVQIIKQAAIETNNTAGDGTTTSTVLARAILREAQKYVTSGVSPYDLQRGIELATKEITEKLKELAQPVRSTDEITHIATISANGDEVVGKLIATAVDQAGKDGAITIEAARSIETSLDLVEGFRFAAGWAASAFITDERAAAVRYDNPLFLVTDEKIEMIDQILPILEVVAREGRPFVLIADSTGEILNRHVGYNPGDEKELEKEILQLLDVPEIKADTLQEETISTPKISPELPSGSPPE